METATLVVSSLALVTSCACLAILLKGAKEASALKSEVDSVKVKVAHNAKVAKAAFNAMEL